MSYVLEEIRKAIHSVDADLVFLQEVFGHHASLKKRLSHASTESQFEFLADTLWHYQSYGKNAAMDDGHYGNAILSKYPIIASRETCLISNRFERRGLLHSEVTFRNGLTLHCICVHLGLTRRGRTAQINKVRNHIAEHVPPDAPLVLAGDFNDWNLRISKALREFKIFEVFHHLDGKYARTYPSRIPVLQLDRIYCRNFHVHKVKALRGKPWNKLSDHIALYAELALK